MKARAQAEERARIAAKEKQQSDVAAREAQAAQEAKVKRDNLTASCTLQITKMRLSDQRYKGCSGGLERNWIGDIDTDEATRVCLPIHDEFAVLVGEYQGDGCEEITGTLDELLTKWDKEDWGS